MLQNIFNDMNDLTKQISNSVINIGLLGFGLSGKVFHAPFIENNQSFRLHSIVTSGTEAGKLYPKANLLPDYQTLLNNPDIDLIVICTPSNLHAEQAILAMKAGKHVVVEKPFAMNSSEVLQMIETAKTSGKLLFPFHNRRWDGDFMTVKHLITDGFLGNVIEFESCFERFSPIVSRAAWRYETPESGGTLFDLGPHLIDQAICLFGKPISVCCKLYFQRETSHANDNFDIKLIYPTLTVKLKADLLIREPGPRFVVRGDQGSFIKFGSDSQEDSLRKGKNPRENNFGHESKQLHGVLHSTANNDVFKGKFKTIQGNYMGFYDSVYDAIATGKEQTIKPEDALLNVQIIEACLKSHNENRNVELN